MTRMPRPYPHPSPHAAIVPPYLLAHIALAAGPRFDAAAEAARRSLLRDHPVREWRLSGELPSPSVSRLIGAILVSSVDHGAMPPSTVVARNVATTGAPLRAAVAAVRALRLMTTSPVKTFRRRMRESGLGTAMVVPSGENAKPQSIGVASSDRQS